MGLSERRDCEVCGCAAQTNIAGAPMCHACVVDFNEWRERKHVQANGVCERCGSPRRDHDCKEMYV